MLSTEKMRKNSGGIGGILRLWQQQTEQGRAHLICLEPADWAGFCRSSCERLHVRLASSS
jgi:hypothetical protein